MTYIQLLKVFTVSPGRAAFVHGGKVDAPIVSCHARDTWTTTCDISERKRSTLAQNLKPFYSTFYPQKFPISKLQAIFNFQHGFPSRPRDPVYTSVSRPSKQTGTPCARASVVHDNTTTPQITPANNKIPVAHTHHHHHVSLCLRRVTRSVLLSLPLSSPLPAPSSPSFSILHLSLEKFLPVFKFPESRARPFTAVSGGGEREGEGERGRKGEREREEEKREEDESRNVGRWAGGSGPRRAFNWEVGETMARSNINATRVLLSIAVGIPSLFFLLFLTLFFFHHFFVSARN